MIKNPYLKTLLLILSPMGPLNYLDIRVSRRQVIELLFCMLIISVLVTIANIEYSDHILRAKITHFTGQLDDKANMFVFHAFNGRWPESKDKLDQFIKDTGLEINIDSHSYVQESEYIENVIIENGAFHILFKEALKGQTLSIRPAVPKTDKTGPVILVSSKHKTGWDIAGVDKTTVDSKLISSYLR